MTSDPLSMERTTSNDSFCATKPVGTRCNPLPDACLAHPGNRHNHIPTHKSPLILGVAFLFQ